MAKQLTPFEQAFADARADKKKTFTFNGKSYTTDLKDDVTRKESNRIAMTDPRNSQEARDSYGKVQGSGLAAKETWKPKSLSDLSPQERKEYDDKINSQGLEGSHPEALLFGGAARTIAKPVYEAGKRIVQGVQVSRAIKKDADELGDRISQRELSENVERIKALEKGKADRDTSSDYNFADLAFKDGGIVSSKNTLMRQSVSFKPNEPTGHKGPGVRSQQDYKK